MSVIIPSASGLATGPGRPLYIPAGGSVAPSISGISVGSGPITGGTVTVISGSNLGSASSVTLDGVAATIGSNTSTSITVTSGAASATGTGNVVVTTPSGTATLVGAWTYTTWYAPLLAIPGCTGLWDASTASSVTLNGSNVSELADLSGLGNHFTQPVAITQSPYNTSGINGLPSIDTRTTSTASGLLCVNADTSIFTGAAATYVTVWKATVPPPTGNGEFQIYWGNPSQDFFPLNSGSTYDGFFTSARKSIGTIDNHTAAIAYAVTSAANEWTAYVNNVQAFTTSTNTTNTIGLSPTMLYDPAGSFWQGLFSFRAVWSRSTVLSSTELSTVQTALQSRFGV